MFAYCNNNPIMGCDPCGTCIHNWKFYDCEKCAEFWNGVGQWCVDAYSRINGVYQQQTQLQTQITMQQNKMIADAAEATWDAYMWSYNQQQEAQLLEAQMTSAVSPRIIKAGWDAGCEAAIYAVAYNEFVRQTQNGDAKAVTTVVAFSFTAGFVAGSCMEIGRIIEEAIVFP